MMNVLDKKDPPLSKQFKVSEHIENLKARYGEKHWVHSTDRLEDFCNPFDPDYLMIIAFRNRVEENTRQQQREYSRQEREELGMRTFYKYVDLKTVKKLILHGWSVPEIADHLNVSISTIRQRINNYPELRKTFEKAHQRDRRVRR